MGVSDTEMKREAIEKATSKPNPSLSGESAYPEWENKAVIGQLK